MSREQIYYTNDLKANLIPMNNNSVSSQLRLVEDSAPPVFYQFLNKRENDPYLKNVFPAGFNTSINRDSASSIIPKSLLLKSEKSSHPNSKSYTSWTLGDESKPPSPIMHKNGDEYADVAGMYFREIDPNQRHDDAVLYRDFEIDTSLNVTKIRIVSSCDI